MKSLMILLTTAAMLLSSYSLAESAVQSARVQKKIDILFVIDNSASMAVHQNQLVAGVEILAKMLSTSALDFHIGITTSDSHVLGSKVLRLRDGVGANHSGVYVATPTTQNLPEVLAINLKQGTMGDGFEAPFQSFKEVLQFAGNGDFRRADAELAILAIGDEDDSSIMGHPVAVSDYYEFLTQFAAGHKATFSTISKLDTSCRSGGDPEVPAAQRMSLLADLTRGFKGNICAMPSALVGFMNFISKDNGVPAAYTIKLDHTPILETIAVKVNGKLVMQDEIDGWTYDVSTNSLTLHGSSIPKKGDYVSVTYDYQE